MKADECDDALIVEPIVPLVALGRRFHVNKDIRNATLASENVAIGQQNVGLSELSARPIPTNTVDALGTFMESTIACLAAVDIMIPHKGDCLRVG